MIGKYTTKTREEVNHTARNEENKQTKGKRQVNKICGGWSKQSQWQAWVTEMTQVFILKTLCFLYFFCNIIIITS